MNSYRRIRGEPATESAEGDAFPRKILKNADRLSGWASAALIISRKRSANTRARKNVTVPRTGILASAGGLTS